MKDNIYQHYNTTILVFLISYLFCFNSNNQINIEKIFNADFNSIFHVSFPNFQVIEYDVRFKNEEYIRLSL